MFTIITAIASFRRFLNLARQVLNNYAILCRLWQGYKAVPLQAVDWSRGAYVRPRSDQKTQTIHSLGSCRHRHFPSLLHDPGDHIRVGIDLRSPPRRPIAFTGRGSRFGRCGNDNACYYRQLGYVPNPMTVTRCLPLYVFIADRGRHQSFCLCSCRTCWLVW